jgi:hypothetical protein
MASSQQFISTGYLPPPRRVQVLIEEAYLRFMAVELHPARLT